MRLTLRTLLAYLDDVLEPTQAKEIGQKIAESPVATSLAQRIREVMRRRRLSAEDLNETGLDPNLVAEYIDGGLEPNEVADVERVCLGSDAHLAEVAACHQILTLVLGEPVEIVPRSRERMYGLAEDGTIEKLQVGGPPAGRSEPSTKSPAEEPTPFPAHLLPAPAWKRALPLLVPIVLIGLWLALIKFDPSLNFFAASPDERSTTDDQRLAKNDNTNSVQPPSLPPAQHEPTTVANGQSPEKPGVRIDPEPPPDQPEATVAAPRNDAATVPGDPPLPRPETTAETTDSVKAPPVVPVPQVETPVARTVGQYKSSSGVLLQYQPVQAGWYVVPYESQLVSESHLIVPEPFRGVVRLENGAPLVQLVGGTSARLLGETEAAPVGIEVTTGRILLDALASETAPVSLRVGSNLWRIEFLEADTRAGIEVRPLPIYGTAQPLPENHFYAAIWVSRGAVRIADGDGASTTIGVRQQLILNFSEGAAPPAAIQRTQVPASLVNPPPVPDGDPAADANPPLWLPQPVALVPQWMNPEQQTLSAIVKRYHEAFQAEFDPLLPAHENMVPLIKDDRPQMSEFAVACLGLIGDVNGLVKALSGANHEEARGAAARALRIWLPRHPELHDEFHLQLGLAFPETSSVAAEKLLWGFSIEEAQQLEPSLQLVDWLDDLSIGVREMAIRELERLTDQLNYGYRPQLSSSARSSSVKRWKNHVETNKGLIPKTP